MKRQDVKVGEEYAFRDSSYGPMTQVKVTGPAERGHVGRGFRGTREAYLLPVESAQGRETHIWKAEARHLRCTWAEHEAEQAREREAREAHKRHREARWEQWGRIPERLQAVSGVSRANLDDAATRLTIHIEDPEVARKVLAALEDKT